MTTITVNFPAMFGCVRHGQVYVEVSKLIKWCINTFGTYLDGRTSDDDIVVCFDVLANLATTDMPVIKTYSIEPSLLDEDEWNDVETLQAMLEGDTYESEPTWLTEEQLEHCRKVSAVLRGKGIAEAVRYYRETPGPKICI
jgi:hypothetical protein